MLLKLDESYGKNTMEDIYLTEPCRCGQACYLTEYGRQTWSQPSNKSKFGRFVSGFQHMTRNAGTTTTQAQLRSRLHMDKGVLSNVSMSTLRSRSQSWLHWLKGNILVVIIVGMLLLTALMPLVWHVRMSQAAGTSEVHREKRKAVINPEADVKLGRIMRSLRAIQGDVERREHQGHVTVNVTITKYPWLRQANTLQNYFLGGKQRFGTSAYTTGDVVFLHQHRSAGSAISDCMANITDSHSLDMLQVWDSATRTMWDKKVQIKGKIASNNPAESKRKVQMHTGQYSFGVCDIYSTRQCSYFTMVRDPMERAVSSYHYCQQVGLHGDNELCRVVDANDVTLRDWILLHGSVTFHQLVFNATWCQNEVLVNAGNLIDGTDVHVAPSRQWPCWLKQRIQMERISKEDRGHMLEYVLENLESWFGVVGVFNEIEKSLAILEEVYGLPFTQCRNMKREDVNFSSQNSGNNHSNKGQKPKDGFYDENDPNYLKYDYFVRKALEPDYEIYKRARNIYNVQRQIVFNTL